MAETINEIPIEKDLKDSYLDYAMSVIVGRAIPDIRDGLKPVHRRILFAMKELGNYHNKPYKKSARIVGDTLGRFHPHGDQAIYDTLVRMAQDFSMRYTLVDGQGNWGSVDGDNAAAMRYTEARLDKITEEMLTDLDKETVDFTPNFDGTIQEPTVLPSKIPNLLINGSSGIAVGMATNIPPHNLSEVVDACIAYIDGADESQLIGIVKGPDFPTGGQILGRSGILQAYKTGRGIIRLRGRTETNEKHITITEIPYQVTKTSIIESIVEGVKNKKIDGISDVHDRSDKQGIEIRIDLKRDANAEVVLNQIYAHTPLESTFGIINLVLVRTEPKILGLYDTVREFVEFRKEIVRRRCSFELNKAEERAHLLEGLRVALQNIDEIVPFLKAAKDINDARAGLMNDYSLSERQANAILDMKLQRLTSLEQQKIQDEHQELQKQITWLKDVLDDISKILNIIKEELADIKKLYADERRTEILDAEDDMTLEELIPNDPIVVMMSKRGYVKRIDLTTYKSQNRGGKGVIGSGTKDEDIIVDIAVIKSHNSILFFTDKGRAFLLKAYQIPEAGRYATGKSIVNLLDIKDEKISAWIAVDEFNENDYLIMATKKGIVKRIALTSFKKPRKTGIIAITLKEGDELVGVLRTDGNQDVILATKSGQSIRFNEKDIREIGRTGQGVIGIRLKNENDEVVGTALGKYPTLLTITENGYGKRTDISEYRAQNRGGSGVINIKTEGRNGNVIGVKSVTEEAEVLIVSSKGQTIRMPVTTISVIGRNTQGVRLIKLAEGEKVADFAIVRHKENEISQTPA